MFSVMVVWNEHSRSFLCPGFCVVPTVLMCLCGFRWLAAVSLSCPVSLSQPFLFGPVGSFCGLGLLFLNQIARKPLPQKVSAEDPSIREALGLSARLTSRMELKLASGVWCTWQTPMPHTHRGATPTPTHVLFETHARRFTHMQTCFKAYAQRCIKPNWCVSHPLVKPLKQNQSERLVQIGRLNDRQSFWKYTLTNDLHILHVPLVRHSVSFHTFPQVLS